MKVIKFFVWIVMSSLVGSVILSWTMQCLWRWFVAHDLGTGPSLGAWFGIATIANVALHVHDDAKSTTIEPFDKALESWVSSSIGKWLGCLIVLGVAWCTGSFMGWIQ